MPKFKVVKLNEKIRKAIGKSDSIFGLSDTEDTVLFIKNDLTRDRISEKNILQRLNDDRDIGNELNTLKSDLFITLSNINSLSSLSPQSANSNTPRIDNKLLRQLERINTTLKTDKKSRFFLEKISDTQKKIYKVISKIEEEMIDEQDTSIKNALKSSAKVASTSVAGVLPTVANASDTSGGLDGLFDLGTKALPYVKNALKWTAANAGKIIRIGGKVILWADFVMLIYYIIKNYNIAEESIDSDGIIEKIIFALFAGVTEWVGMHLDMFKWLVDNFVEICEYMQQHLHEFAEEFQSLSVLFKGMEYGIKILPVTVVCEYVLKPVFDFLKEKGAYGVPCGVCAVQFYRDCKNAIMMNVPNSETFRILFGKSKEIDSVRNLGLYEYNRIGASDIKGSAKDLAKLATRAELEKLIEHNDLDSYELQKVRDALSIKDIEGIKDEDVLNTRNSDNDLNELYDKLCEKPDALNKPWKKLFATLMKYSREIVKTTPEATLITYCQVQGKPTTLNTQHLLWDNDVDFGFSSSVDAPQTIFSGVIEEIGFKFNFDTDIFYITPYGTIIISMPQTDPIQAKNMLERNLVKNPKLKDGVFKRIFRVIGYFDSSFKFHHGFVHPKDKVIKEFKHNIMTSSDIGNWDSQVIKASPKPTDESIKNDKDTKNITHIMLENGSSSQTDIDNSVNLDKTFSSAELTGANFMKGNSYSNLSKTDVTDRIYNFFKSEFGMTDPQIAGIMGNLYVESAKFSMKAIQGEHMDRSKSGKNDGMSGGLCQWHDVNGKGRLSALKKFASSMNRDWRDLDVQLMFLKHELETTHKKALKAVLSSKTVQESAHAWVYNFERPADMLTESIKRSAIGNSFLEMYNNLPSGSNASNASNIQNSDNSISIAKTPNQSIPSYVPLDPNNQINKEQSSPKSDGSDDSNANKSSILEYASSLIKGTVYSQPNRYQDGYFDCSSFIGTLLRSVGYNYDKNLPSTLYMGNALKRVGFSKIGNANAKNQSNVQPGDILLKPGKHVMLYAGNGNVIEANGYNGNHNGINRWGSLHNKYDSYEIWRDSANLVTAKIPNAYDMNKDITSANYSNDTSNYEVSGDSSYSSSSTDKQNQINLIIANKERELPQDIEYEGIAEEMFKFKINDII